MVGERGEDPAAGEGEGPGRRGVGRCGVARWGGGCGRLAESSRRGKAGCLPGVGWERRRMQYGGHSGG